MTEIAERLGIKEKILEIAENEARMVEIDRCLEKELKEERKEN